MWQQQQQQQQQQQRQGVGLPPPGRAARSATFKGFSTPAGVAISPDASFALVANQSGHNVGRIDLRTGTVTFPYCGFKNPP